MFILLVIMLRCSIYTFLCKILTIYLSYKHRGLLMYEKKEVSFKRAFVNNLLIFISNCFKSRILTQNSQESKL